MHNRRALDLANRNHIADNKQLRYDWHMKSSMSTRTKGARYRNHVQKLTMHLPAPLRRLFFVYGVCILASALTAGALIYTRDSPPLPDPFSATQRSAVAFTLHYPKALPDSFYIDVASLGRLEESVVAMSITDGRGQTFTLSQQALSPAIDLEALHQSFGGRTSFKTKLGQATTGIIDDGKTRIVSLVAEDKTWLIVQAPAAIRLSDIQTTLNALERSR